ncbi:hypothetical protein ACPA9J_34445 [Pseudomonas aeruginosa]
MRNPERSALLKVGGALGSTVVAMGLGLSSAPRAEESDSRIQPACRSPADQGALLRRRPGYASVPAGAPNEA